MSYAPHLGYSPRTPPTHLLIPQGKENPLLASVVYICAPARLQKHPPQMATTCSTLPITKILILDQNFCFLDASSKSPLAFAKTDSPKIKSDLLLQL